jgi:3-methylfumaryl-CoA hydratase
LSEQETFAERLSPGPAVALAGLLGQDTSVVTEGFVLPPMWHLVYLLERPAHSELGPEGHPVHGIPQPPSPGLRRMFAGGRVRNLAPLRVGTSATRTTRVAEVRKRSGRTGDLTIVTTESLFERNDGVVAVIEEQDIVYREARKLPPPDPATARRLPEDVKSQSFPVDEALLFQFSALTYNAHRIHYDADYCRNVEDYDGLVVHGPLQALLMAQAANRELEATGWSGPTTFSYRLVAPMTLGQGLRIAVGSPTPDSDGASHTWETFAADGSGRVTAVGKMKSAADTEAHGAKSTRASAES